jgi:hypothetical protein
MRWGKFEIYCANCGRVIDFNGGWRESLSKLVNCGEACNSELSLKYARMIMRKDNPPLKVLQDTPSQSPYTALDTASVPADPSLPSDDS